MLQGLGLEVKGRGGIPHLSGFVGGEATGAHVTELSPIQDLPVVVFINGDGPPLIDRVDDVGFDFEGKPK
jgi:hypothetical protein